MDELIPLREAHLSRLSTRIKVPNYDRRALKPGIVHVGLGNFHRAHQAWYLHRLMEMGMAHDWAIIGAGVRPPDAGQRERLMAQDFLTTLIELDPSGKSAEIIGSMIGFVPVESDNAALIAQMSAPDIRIVSLTVTEGGYYIDPATGDFDASHPDMVHDAANPERPRTVFGAMIAALKSRRATGAGPFTGLSCDNLQGNGAILHRTIVSLARLSDADLAAWIDTNCAFPNSMVDCIVPATAQKELALSRAFGVDDRAPVTHENFRQWVIEDRFCAGRPDWDKVGATFSDQVHDYEAMKLRVLNGGHQIVSIAGDLLGIELISGAMADKAIRGFLRQTMLDEVLPNVKPVPGMTAEAYLDSVERRFSNQEIIDTTRRVAFDGSSRQPGFIVPSIRDALAYGQPIECLALVSALWMRYCLGTREDGSTIEANDPAADELKHKAQEAASNPILWISQERYYGALASNGRFSASFARWVETLQGAGIRQALTQSAEKYALSPLP